MHACFPGANFSYILTPFSTFQVLPVLGPVIFIRYIQLLSAVVSYHSLFHYSFSDDTCSIFRGIDPSSANWVPNFSPDAEKTVLDGVGCASKCTDYTWCSSFFIQTSGRCLMFKTVFIKKAKMVSSPGTVYNRIYSDDCPVEECYYKSREHNLCLFFFGLGPDSVRLSNQESVDKCSAINGHLPILDTKNKMEWVKGIFWKQCCEFRECLDILPGRARLGFVLHGCCNQGTGKCDYYAVGESWWVWGK